MNLLRQIDDAVSAIRRRSKAVPEVGIILGTGLGALAGRIDDEAVIPYAEVPGFVEPTVAAHAGRLHVGRLGGKCVIAMEGRFHLYEGYTPDEITFPVRLMRALGAGTLVVSNAAGGLNPEFVQGDLMLITDHINLLGDNPLIGPNDDELGPRYPDMSQPYNRRLITLAEAVALEKGIRVVRGVLAAMTGPSLETAAEYRFLRIIGADAIGMSTIPEVIVAVHAGMKVLGISCITDSCLPESLKPVDIERIVAVALEAEPRLTDLMAAVVERC